MTTQFAWAKLVWPSPPYKLAASVDHGTQGLDAWMQRNEQHSSSAEVVRECSGVDHAAGAGFSVSKPHEDLRR